MQDIRNYIVILVTISSIIIFFYVLFLTRREIELERKFNSFALSTNKKSSNILDFIASFILKIIKIFSKFTIKIKLANKLSERYEKYILLSTSMITKIDIITLKSVCFVGCFIITFLLEYFSVINITYISVLIISICVYMLPDIILYIKYQNKRNNISLEIIDAILLINNNLKKDLNIINAIDEASKEVSDTLKILFNKVKIDLENGVDLALAFKNFSNIICLNSTFYISKTITELSYLNISVNETFDYLVMKLKEQKRKEEGAMIYFTSVRLISKIIVSIPLIIVLLLVILKPNYFVTLFHSLPALLLFLSLILIYISYVIIIKRLLKRGGIYE